MIEVSCYCGVWQSLLFVTEHEKQYNRIQALWDYHPKELPYVNTPKPSIDCEPGHIPLAAVAWNPLCRITNASPAASIALSQESKV